MQNSTVRQQTNRMLGYAAVFVDFENVFYYLKDNYADLPDLNDYIFDMLRNLKVHLERKLGLQSIIMKAYADFEQLKSAPQGGLYVMGVETHNVLGTEHKNAADMRLCIDALEVLYTRPEIENFVFMAGDRDYIPVIQHLKKQARSVHAVAFRGNISGDLLLNVGSRYFIDAVTLIDPVMLRRLENSSRRQREIERVEQGREVQKIRELEQREAAQVARETGVGAETQDGAADETHSPIHQITDDLFAMNGTNGLPITTNGDADNQEMDDEQGFHGIVVHTDFENTEFSPVMLIENETEKICIDVLLRSYGHHNEIWMSPYLRKLSDALPRLADFERKALLTSLESMGAIRIEKRRGEPYDYSIVMVNYNHPDVRAMMPQ